MIHYFKVEPNTEASALVDGFRARLKLRGTKSEKARKEMGIPKVFDFFGSDSSIFGIISDKEADPGKGWKRDNKRGCFIPDRKTDEGKQFVKIMATIPPGIDWMRESASIFNHGMTMDREGGGFCIRFATCAWSKSGAVFRMHSIVKKSAKKWPTGLVEITGTEASSLIPTSKD